jgi:hypothetical protein
MALCASSSTVVPAQLFPMAAATACGPRWVYPCHHMACYGVHDVRALLVGRGRCTAPGRPTRLFQFASAPSTTCQRAVGPGRGGAARGKGTRRLGWGAEWVPSRHGTGPQCRRSRARWSSAARSRPPSPPPCLPRGRASAAGSRCITFAVSSTALGSAAALS